jgi:alkanesulfonate monooxygenase SsuD/methylene tetrahydromethanopterin reductase-like flavin-dependent oxidoreductase (luciferase family)
MTLQMGLDTFGDVTVDRDGRPVPQDHVIRDLVEEGVLADQVGVDAIGVGEHHRPDFAVSSPETVLAAIATRTERITLGSAVTVLSSDDPVRVFQRFSTVDALSNGRAEVTLGRGSFIESFPLFGFDLADYETLFAEKLDLFAALLDEQPLQWSGTTRAPLDGHREAHRDELLHALGRRRDPALAVVCLPWDADAHCGFVEARECPSRRARVSITV